MGALHIMRCFVVSVALAVFALVAFIFISFEAGAQGIDATETDHLDADDTVRRTDRARAIRLDRAERRDAVRDTVTGVRDTRKNVRTDRAEVRDTRSNVREERAASRTERLNERAKERISAFMQRIIRRFEAAVRRLNRLADRIDSRIAKFEDRKSTAEAQALLVEARAQIDAAQALLDSLPQAFERALASDDPRASFEVVRADLNDAKESLKSAHAALVRSIIALKGPGDNADGQRDDSAGLLPGTP